ncbi:putative holin [Oceanobacter kriegii]|uniref:putative holin n=1 Tax=Oceanobacter kriegii TaxID=64972 RepID=UPI0003FC3DFC|nr:putative holin [Oceanobacter kriegii]
MPEPTAATVSVTSLFGISLASIVLGIDANTAIGAFAGATLFITSARELNLATRFVYLLISVVIGYHAAGEITAHTPIAAPAIAGFIGGLCSISAGLLLIRQLQEGNLTNISNLFKVKK